MKLLWRVVEVTTSLSKIWKSPVVHSDVITLVPLTSLLELAVSEDTSLSLDVEHVGVEDDLSAVQTVRMAEVEAECQTQLVAAQQAAEQLLAEAYDQAKQIRLEAQQQGYSEGFVAGHAEGSAAAQAEFQQAIKHAQSVAQAIQLARIELLQSLSIPLTQVTMEAVRAVLQRELHLQSADIASIVDGLLQYVMESHLVEVRVHPEDFAAASAAQPKWKSAKFGEWEVVIVPDLGIAQGGCELRSQVGRVDARVQTRLETLEEHLRSVVESEVASIVS